MEEQNLKLSDDQIKVQIAKCPACNRVVKMTVIRHGKPFSKDILKEYSALMLEGCILKQVPLLKAQKLKMCFLDCDKPLVVSRNVLTEKNIIKTPIPPLCY